MCPLSRKCNCEIFHSFLKLENKLALESDKEYKNNEKQANKLHFLMIQLIGNIACG